MGVLFWTGVGWLPIPFFILNCLGLEFVKSTYEIPHPKGWWIFVAFLPYTLITLGVGLYLNRDRSQLEVIDCHYWNINLRSRHTLDFVPMPYFALVPLLIQVLPENWISFVGLLLTVLIIAILTGSVTRK